MIFFIKLLVCSCIFCVSAYFLVGGMVSFIICITTGNFLIPDGQVERSIIWGCITGAVITFIVMFFNLMDRLSSRKKTRSDYE